VKLKILALIFIMPLVGCHKIRTQITIDAPAETVWSVFTSTGDYSEWNSFMRIEGELKKDNSLKITVSPPGKDPMEFEPRIMQFDQHELLWRGRLLIPGIFTGEHRFYLEKISENQVVFHQDEDFSGILVPFIDPGQTKLGFETMNAELKARAEGR